MWYTLDGTNWVQAAGGGCPSPTIAPALVPIALNASDETTLDGLLLVGGKGGDGNAKRDWWVAESSLVCTNAKNAQSPTSSDLCSGNGACQQRADGQGLECVCTVQSTASSWNACYIEYASTGSSGSSGSGTAGSHTTTTSGSTSTSTGGSSGTSSGSTTSGSSGGDTPSDGISAGGAVGVALLVVALVAGGGVALWWFVIRPRMKPSQDAEEAGTVSKHVRMRSVLRMKSDTSELQMNSLIAAGSSESWKIDADQVEFEAKIAAGASGQVS